MKLKNLIAISLLALCIPAFAKTGANKANTTKVTYNLLSGGTMTNQAEGKPKILIFFQANDAKSREVAKNVAASYSSLSSSVDICFVETKRSSKAIVTKFRDNYASSSVNVAYDSTTAAATSMQEYMKLLIGKAASISNPLVVFIDKNNKVQHEAHGQKFTVAQIKEFATDYVGANFSSSGGNSNSGGNVTTPNPSTSIIGSVSSAYKGITLNGKLLDKTAEVRIKKSTINTKPDLRNGRYEGVFTEGRVVTLSSYIIGKYEVTQELYETVMKDQKVTVDGKTYTLDANPSLCVQGSSKYAVPNAGVQKYRPVDNISWYDAVYFCNVLSEKLGLKKAYKINVKNVFKNTSGLYRIADADVSLVKGADGYRLPTEAEWEFAARGGNVDSAEWKYIYSGTNNDIDSVAWYVGNNKTGTTDSTYDDSQNKPEYQGSHETGLKKPNSLGIYDMSGNIYEYCYDSISYAPGCDDIVDKKETVTDPIGEENANLRILRGGNWGSMSPWLQVGARSINTPSARSHVTGMRLARTAQ